MRLLRSIPRVPLGIGLIGTMWGLAFVFTKASLYGFTTTEVVFLRVLIASIVVAAVVRGGSPGRGWASLRKISPWIFIALGLLNTAFPYWLITLAQNSIPSSTAAVFNATAPILTILIAVSTRRESFPTGRRLAGVSVGFLGIVVMANFVVAGFTLAGLALLLAALSYASAFVLAAHPSLRQADSSALAAVQMMVGTAVLGIVLAFSGPPFAATVTLGPVMAVVALAVFSTALPALIYFGLVRAGGPTKASLTSYVVPVVGILVGWIVFGEFPGVLTLVGTVIVLFGLFLTQVPRPARY